jgi:hypothetical protein
MVKQLQPSVQMSARTIPILNFVPQRPNHSGSIVDHSRQMTENTIQCIDWKVIGPAMTHLPTVRRCWVMKHI